MIVRLYMALSEFTFDIKFIFGEDNDIADSMSRLCRNDMIDNPFWGIYYLSFYYREV